MDFLEDAGRATCFNCNAVQQLGANFSEQGKFQSLYCSKCSRLVENVSDETVAVLEHRWKELGNLDRLDNIE